MNPSFQPLTSNLTSTGVSLPQKQYCSAVNRKKLMKRYHKQNYKYREYPLLNLWILITSIIASIQSFIGTQMGKFIHLVPIPLMVLYISNKSSQRSHLVPKLIKLGLILSFIGDCMTFFDSQKAGKLIGSLCYIAGIVLYILGMNLGQNVRNINAFNQFLMKISAFILFLGLLWKQYKFLEYQTFSSKNINRSVKFTQSSNKNTQTTVLPLVFTILLISSAILFIVTLLRYKKTSPYSYNFSLAGGICLFLSTNLWKYQYYTNPLPNLTLSFIIYSLYYSGNYILMHGSLHHSNMLYQIDNFIKNKQKQITCGIGQSVAQNSIYKSSYNQQLHFDIGNSYPRQKQADSDSDSDDAQQQQIRYTLKTKTGSKNNKSFKNSRIINKKRR